MDNEIKNFKAELYKIAWFMRGGVTLDELFGTSHEDRQVMAKVIKENLQYSDGLIYGLLRKECRYL